MRKGWLPCNPYFVHITDGWERWNCLVPGYAVVGRVTRSTQPGHEGEFWFVTANAEGEYSGYKPTLVEAQQEVMSFVEDNFEIEKRTQTYCGA